MAIKSAIRPQAAIAENLGTNNSAPNPISATPLTNTSGQCQGK